MNEKLNTLITIIFMLLLMSCAHAPTKEGASPPPAFRGNGQVRYHAWTTLFKPGDESPGYGYYTYVLFNKKPDTKNSRHRPLIEKYETLLSEIISTQHSSNISGDKVKAANIFFIPGKADYRDVGSDYLGNYDHDSAFSYINLVNSSVSDATLTQSLNRNPGPFLVSSTKPLLIHTNTGAVNENSESMVMLYADLSDTNTAAIAQIIDSYKTHMLDNRLEEFERFFSLKDYLLNWVLNADDNLKIMKVAVADFVPNK